MSSQKRVQSLFSQQFDRAILATYFLGAVVPLLAAAYVVQRYVLPAVDKDVYATALVLGLVFGVGTLSLAAFFALRRLSFSAVERMNADNERLAAILATSRSLVSAPHAIVAAQAAAACAARMTGADAVLVLFRSDPGKPLDLLDAAGEDGPATYEQHGEELSALALSSMASGEATPVTPIGAGAAVAIPMGHEPNAPGAFVVYGARQGRTGRDGTDPIFRADVLDAASTLAGLTVVALHSAHLKDSQRNFFTHTTEIMVMALDAHVAHRAGHGDAVALIANQIGRELGLDEEALRNMHFASMLQDIGMLKLSAKQQQNPAQLAKHPQLGHRMLSHIVLWEPLAKIVLHHHDHFDGEGRPDTLVGEQIPIESRVIHASDTYVGLTSAAGAEELRTSGAACEEIAAGSGTQFDPRVVEALTTLADQGDLD